jgi:crotonobetainyl-CoA:carnitine CoA-transferase CaiB-like acyl-CoA transferase
MKRPLEGCRVLDLGIITAGAATAALLADLGADVIKVESPSYRDPFRVWTPPADLPMADETSPFFRVTNRGKRGISLNMKQPSGRDAFLRLVANSDVVVENFRRGVLERLGIGFSALTAANSRMILASISSQGETGPMAQYVSFGSTLEAVGGLAAVSGDAEGPPVISGKELNLPDQLIAIFAASMITTAWLARQNGGGAVHLDMSQRELTSFMLGEQFAAATVTRSGNAHAFYAMQDCLATRDGWLAVSVLPEQRPALDGVMAGASLADWFGGRTTAACVEPLAAAGIAAAPVLDGAGVLAARGAMWSMALVDDPRHGLLKGFPFQLDQAPLRVLSDAPAIGADTRQVLAEVAGCTEAEIDALLASGVAEGT